MANIYTKTGDKGQTGLYGGERVWKDSLQVEAYGTVDETVSAMGAAYALSGCKKVRDAVHQIQRRLFILGAELASDRKGKQLLKDRVDEEDIKTLEGYIDDCVQIIGEQHQFVVPGENQVSAAFHIARTVARRAERMMIRLSREEEVREELIRYMNRLSDTLYAFARLEEHEEKIRQISQKVMEKIQGVTREDRQKDQQSGDLPKLNLQTAQKLASYAQEKAEDMGISIVVSVVCAGGNLILLHRMDGSLLVSVKVAEAKAYTANSFKMRTKDLSPLMYPNQALHSIENVDPKITSVAGGVPYFCGGRVVGGVGVSGGTAEEDRIIVEYALEKLRGGEE